MEPRSSLKKSKFSFILSTENAYGGQLSPSYLFMRWAERTASILPNKRKGANVKSLRIKGSVQLQGVGIDIPFYFRIVSEFEKGCKITDEIKH